MTNCSARFRHLLFTENLTLPLHFGMAVFIGVHRKTYTCVIKRKEARVSLQHAQNRREIPLPQLLC